MKYVAVTGSSGYFGKIICNALAVSHKVFALHRKDEKIFSNDNIIEVHCDLSSDDSIENAYKLLCSKTDQLDVLINNAAYCSTKSFMETSRSDFAHTIDGCVGQIHEMIKCYSNFFEQTKLKKVINIASMYGLVAPIPTNYTEHEAINPVAYGAAKAALIQYTKYAAMMLSSRSILVNAISYGPFPNPEKVKDKLFVQNLAKSTMIGRVGEEKDVVSPINFLLSSDQTFLTGQNIVYDGGWTSW